MTIAMLALVATLVGRWRRATRRARSAVTGGATLLVLAWPAIAGRADELPSFELLLHKGASATRGEAGPAIEHPLRSPDAQPAAPTGQTAQLLVPPTADQPVTVIQLPAQPNPPPPEPSTLIYPQTGAGDDLSIRPIGALTINILPTTGRLPQFLDRTESTEGQLGKNEFHRDLLDYSYRWESTSFHCNPLYFEQPNLERYGYHWGILQPFVSGAQFFVKIPLMPYGLANHHWREPIYSLGYYRPGSYAPYQINWPEVRIWPAFVEGGFITALVHPIP